MASTRGKPKPKQPELTPVAQVAQEHAGFDVVAGLDTASNRFHLYSSGWEHYHVCAKGTPPDERRHQLYDAAGFAFSMLSGDTLLICEEPLALQNGKTTRLLGLAAGAIWAAHLRCNNIWWAWADVSAWKKKVIGAGNANKEQIVAWVQENMGLSWDSKAEEDFYDAAALCRYGELCLGLA